MTCAACRLTRDAVDLIAFWPVADSTRVRYACRPTRPANEEHPGPPCFGAVVEGAAVHAIAFASSQAARAPLVEAVRPWTPAWFGLMREAGVRAA